MTTNQLSFAVLSTLSFLLGACGAEPENWTSEGTEDDWAVNCLEGDWHANIGENEQKQRWELYFDGEENAIFNIKDRPGVQNIWDSVAPDKKPAPPLETPLIVELMDAGQIKLHPSGLQAESSWSCFASCSGELVCDIPEMEHQLVFHYEDY